MAKRSAWAAALFSVITPGLGQLYNGRPARAAAAASLVVVGQGIVLLASLLPPETSTIGYMQIGLRGLGLLLILAILFDAAVGARRAGKVELRRFNHPGVYLLVLAAWMAEQQAVNHLERSITASDFYAVSSDSMDPTLSRGDYVFAHRGYYSANAVTRGDVAAFRDPGDPSRVHLLRVIGLPGDRVAIENGVPILNGEALARQSAEQDVQAPEGIPRAFSILAETLPGGASYRVSERSGASGFAENRPEIEVPDGTVFLLGDNRDSATDSRIFGPIPIESLESRLTFIAWSDGRTQIGNTIQPGD
jgi:signal peptidase I